MSSTAEIKYPIVQDVRGVFVPPYFLPECVEEALDLVPKKEDIVLVTYPKCGTNWTAQILMLLKTRGVPPGNEQSLMRTCPYLELTGTDVLKDLSDPRCYRVHFNYLRVPKSPEAKFIYVTRNPKDCLVSLYNFVNSDRMGFKGGDFNVFLEVFAKGQVLYNDYFDHLLSWYEHRHDSNVLFLYYEEMKEDIEESIRKIADFLGPEFSDLLSDKKVLGDVIKYSSLEYMKSTTNELMAQPFRNAAKTDDIDGLKLPKGVTHMAKTLKEKKIMDTHAIVRKGLVGEWKSVLTSAQNEVMDALVEKRIKGTEMYNYWKSIDCI